MKANIYTWSGIRFAQTRKDVAQRAILANPNRRFFIVGNKTNPSHFHSGWQLATHVDTVSEFSKRHLVECDQSYLDKQYNSFNFYLEPELGDRPIYYLEVLTPAKKAV